MPSTDTSNGFATKAALDAANKLLLALIVIAGSIIASLLYTS